MKVLAIDPGYERLGVAILEKKDNAHKEELIFSDCLRTSASIPHHQRLLSLGKKLSELIETYKPEILAIETLFFNKNQKTAFHVAEARGTILYEASRNGMNVYEFTPPEIKIAVTGYGKSDKYQVTAMVKKIIIIKKEIKYDDEYDAIAIGITYFAMKNSLDRGLKS